MNAIKGVCFFCARLCAIAIMCLVAGVGIYAQEIEEGAVPPWASGEEGAPITIEIFDDYQCPPSASMNEELKKVEANYPNQVLIVFRNYPLVRIHSNAFAAATAAEAAGFQGKFREMIDLLYARQDQWSIDKDPSYTFVSYARGLGLDPERFTYDMASELVAKRISLDMKRAEFLRVKGTPTLFMNGKKLEPFEQQKLLEVVRAALLSF